MLFCLWPTATNILTVQCNLFYLLLVFEPHREGTKLLTDIHITLLHNARTVYPSDLKKGLMLDPSNTYAALHQGFSRDLSPTPGMLDTMKGAAKSAGTLLRACNLLPTVYLTSS